MSRISIVIVVVLVSSNLFSQDWSDQVAVVSTVSTDAPARGTRFAPSVSGSASIQTKLAAKAVAQYLQDSLSFVPDTKSPKVWLIVGTAVSNQGTKIKPPSADEVTKGRLADALGAFGNALQSAGNKGRVNNPYISQGVQGTPVEVYVKTIAVTLVAVGTTQAEFDAGGGVLWQGQVDLADDTGESLSSSLPRMLDNLFDGYPNDQESATYRW